MQVTEEMVVAAKNVLRQCEAEKAQVDIAVRRMLEAAHEAWWNGIVLSAVRGVDGKP